MECGLAGHPAFQVTPPRVGVGGILEESGIGVASQSHPEKSSLPANPRFAQGLTGFEGTGVTFGVAESPPKVIPIPSRSTQEGVAG